MISFKEAFGDSQPDTINNTTNKSVYLEKTQANAIKKDRLNMLLSENLNHILNSTNYTVEQQSEALADQWWQLFDTKRKKFFYYNPNRQQTTWQRPVSLKINDEKENCINGDLVEDSNSVIVIPLASKLIERINNNLSLLKKSKRFLKLLKKKLDVDLKYENTDLTIITTLTERLLNLQTTLTTEQPIHSNNTSITPSSSTSTFFDLSDFEMTNPQQSENFNYSPTSTKLGTSISSPNESNSSLLGSCYSFQSIEANPSSSSINSNTAKRRLQPRTNPNYINVDFINTRNGSLIKNTYIKLQDLTNQAGNEVMEGGNNSANGVLTDNETSCSSKKNGSSKNSFSTVSQAVILLISLLNNNTSSKKISNSETTKTKTATKDNNLVISQSSSINTLNPKVTGVVEQGHLSMGSSSTTLISDNSMNITDFGSNVPNNNMNSSTMSKIGQKKKLMSFQSAAEMGSNKYRKAGTKSYSASLTKKNLDKNNVILMKTALINSEFIDRCNNNSDHKTSTPHNDFKPTVFSLFTKNKNGQPKTENHEQIEYNQNFHQSSTTPHFSPFGGKMGNNRNGLSKELFNASSSSSLADIRNISTESNGNGQPPPPLNHRLQTFKRSFNKKNSFKKIKSPDGVIFNNENNADPRNNESLDNHIDLNASFESHRFPFSSLDIIDSPTIQNKKQSQTNLLLLNNTLIDLNTSHHTRRIRNGFLLFSAKKKVPQSDLLQWTNQSIQKPIIKTNDKVVKKEACELFKLIQVYMSDRKLTSNYLPNISDTSAITNSSFTKLSNLSGSVMNSQEQTKLYHKNLVCLETMTKGWIYPQLRDELYMQLVKQTTDNPTDLSLQLGWELITICLSFFPPSQKMFPFLTEYIFLYLTGAESSELAETFTPPNEGSSGSVESAFSIHLINMSKRVEVSEDMPNRMAHACLKRLERIHLTGAKKGLKKPTLDEILLSRQTIVSPSLFGTTLDEIMNVQKSKCPNLALPWVQTTLSEAVLRLSGAKTEGIFRVPGDLDEVNNLKVKYDQLWCIRNKLDSDEDKKIFQEFMSNIQDAHLPASLLKLWYRELYDPLIPNEFYEECIKNCDKPKECISVIQRLPTINRLVFTYLIRFLKVFAASDNVAVTKMDASNLSMIMAPNCLRCKSNEPKVIMENTKKEMQFLNTLIHHLDTTCVQGLV